MMLTRQRWLKLSGWSIPLAYAVAALALGMTLPRLEHYFLPDLVSTMSAASAVAICSAIASGMIALTGIVFSLMFVMVQFSAMAYSPRLVLWIARDPVMSHALGVFSATFLYSLGMTAWVDRGGSGQVPVISTWLVLALLLASVGMFIALIERIGALQINRMLIFTCDQGRASIEDLYGSVAPAATSPGTADSHDLPITQTLAHVGRPQVIQVLRLPALVELASVSNAVIELVITAGDTVVESTPLLRVRGGRQPLEAAALRGALEMGDERTFDQDPKYALRIIVDIAIKALSPAINDPTTAVQALDQIEDLLLRLGRCRLEIGAFHDPAGRLRLIVPFPTWDDFLLLALDEIRAYGADSVQVMRRMKALIKHLTNVLPSERHAALRHWDKRLEDSIKRTFIDTDEKRAASVPDRQGLGIGQEGTGGP